MTRLHQLFDEQGQAPWLDNLKRDYLTDGTLERLVAEGVRGVTSNPTIFQKAIAGGSAYDEHFASLVKVHTVEDAYWGMVVQDIEEALRLLRPVYDASGGSDGFVSLEVAPSLAFDTDATVRSARHLHDRIAEPNLMVKVPATAEGVPAIRQLIAEGRNINVTLIFGLERYADVVDAYLDGLEAFDGDLSQVNSVASFFISRVDTELDRRLDAVGSEEAKALQGKGAVAQGVLAYELFRSRFSGPRWEALVVRGAKVQRPLWASTSTKNPAYPELLYVETLIGPDTVNTMPDPTLEAFADHGTVARTVDADVDGARARIERLGAVGVDLADVSRVLEEEGVAAFAKSFDELMQALQDKANAIS